ncbi:MAG: hypothetical protein WD271_03215 [Acidimicrobiia bacterium]
MLRDVVAGYRQNAKQHLTSARAIADASDLSGAYQLADDALRKSAAALLAVQGLRATSRGGHIAVQDAVIAQFEETVRTFRPFGRLRRNRNRFEYPGDAASEPMGDDVDDALTVTTETVARARTIIDQEVLDPWTG